MTELVTT